MFIALKNAVTSAPGIAVVLEWALQGPVLLAAAGLDLLADLLTCIRMIRGPEVSDDLISTLVCPRIIVRSLQSSLAMHQNSCTYDLVSFCTDFG